MDELKPCPFCGVDIILEANLSRGEWYICDCCGAESGGNGVDGWNTRPIEDKLKAENDRLTNELDRVKNTFAEIANEIYRLGFVTHHETKHLMRLLRYAIDKDTYVFYEKS